MLQIPITNIPNQSLSIALDGNQYDINIQSTADNPDGSSGISAFDITINNVVIVTGVRAVACSAFTLNGVSTSWGYFLIAFQYLENGNFAVVTNNQEYPDWRQFGLTQNLIYVSQAELEAIRANSNGT